MIDLSDLHSQYIFSLCYAKTWQAQRDSDCARSKYVAAPIGEETGPILRCFEVELVDIEQKLLDFCGGENVMKEWRSLALVLVGHAVAEKRPDCLKPADASDHLKRLVVWLFFHY